jgi:hypothetical protein
MIKSIIFSCAAALSGMLMAQVADAPKQDLRKPRKVVIIKRNTSDSSYARVQDSAINQVVLDLQGYSKKLEEIMDSMDQIVIIIPGERPGYENPPYDVDMDPTSVEINNKDPRKPDNVIWSSYTQIGASNPRDANFSKPNGFPSLNNAKSIHLGLSKNAGFNLIKGKLRLWAGLQYDINNLRFSDNKTTLDPNGDKFISNIDTQSRNIKSKVVANYIAIPIAIGYQENPNDDEEGFWIKAGVSAGYLVRTHSKVKTSEGKKIKEFNSFGFNDFAITPFVEAGYNSFGMYARYGLLPVFGNSASPSGNMLQFGVVFK